MQGGERVARRLPRKRAGHSNVGLREPPISATCIIEQPRGVPCLSPAGTHPMSGDLDSTRRNMEARRRALMVLKERHAEEWTLPQSHIGCADVLDSMREGFQEGVRGRWPPK